MLIVDRDINIWYLYHILRNNIRKYFRRATDPNAPVLYTGVAALNPDVLHAQAEESVRALLQEGQSANTARSYASALRYWAAWFRLRYRAAIVLPVPVPVVLQFVVDHVARVTESGVRAHDLPPAIDAALVQAAFKTQLGPPKLATVLLRLSVISKAHTVAELLNPIRDVQAQELLRRVRRAHAQRGELSQSKQALTKEPLEAMLATYRRSLGARDRALLLFAWASGGRRRSEVSRAVMEQLIVVDASTYLYRLIYTKTAPGSACGTLGGLLCPLAAFRVHDRSWSAERAARRGHGAHRASQCSDRLEVLPDRGGTTNAGGESVGRSPARRVIGC